MRDSKGLYWALILTFFVLYLLVGFVSTLHSITFFELSNTMGLAVLLGVTYEVGQAAVLFSILTSKNNQNLLPWTLMVLLTALQVSANVYASFKFMDLSPNHDWTYWQRSILFWLEADGPETFKVVISWISGALLPVVALGMTALVADNLKLKDEAENEESNKVNTEKSKEDIVKEKTITNTIERSNDDIFTKEVQNGTDTLYEKTPKESINSVITPDLVPIQEVSSENITYTLEDDIESINLDTPANSKEDNGMIISNTDIIDSIGTKPPIKKEKPTEIEAASNNISNTNTKTPHTKTRGWHLKNTYIDSNGDVYKKGVYQPGVNSGDINPPKPDKLKKVKG